MTNTELAILHLENLRKLITPTGLFWHHRKNVETGYDKAWLRDNVYEALAFEYAGDWAVVSKTYHTLLDIFDKHIDKINWAITINHLKAGSLFMLVTTQKL